MSKPSAAVVVLAGVLLAACVPTVHTTPLGEAFEPRAGIEDVAVFSTLKPACAYREIALLTAYGAGLAPNDLDAVLATLRQRARAVGADAVIGLHVVHRAGEPPRSGYSGTAIRFEDETCTQ